MSNPGLQDASPIVHSHGLAAALPSRHMCRACALSLARWLLCSPCPPPAPPPPRPRRAGGVCGSCVGKLVSGEIDNSWQCELDDGNVLSADQMAAGWILPCSSKPKSDLVVEYR